MLQQSNNTVCHEPGAQLLAKQRQPHMYHVLIVPTKAQQRYSDFKTSRQHGRFTSNVQMIQSGIVNIFQEPLIEALGGTGGLCKPNNSSLTRILIQKFIKPHAWPMGSFPEHNGGKTDVVQLEKM